MYLTPWQRARQRLRDAGARLRRSKLKTKTITQEDLANPQFKPPIIIVCEDSKLEQSFFDDKKIAHLRSSDFETYRQRGY